MKVERYTDRNGNACVRIKFMDQYSTEATMPESVFEKQYGKIEQYVA